MKISKQPIKTGGDIDSASELASKIPGIHHPLLPRVLVEAVRRFLTDFRTQFATVCFLGDAILLNFCFFMIHLMRKSSVGLSLSYLKLFVVFNLVWLPVAILTQKFSVQKYKDFNSSLLIILKSTLYMAYVLTFIIIILELFVFSRAHLFGTCFLYGISQIIVASAYFLIRGKETPFLTTIEPETRDMQYRFSARKLLANFLLITGAFYSLNYMKRGAFVLSNDYEKALLLIYGVWFITAIYTGKFQQRRHSNFIYAITPYVKSLILSIAVLSVIVFLFRLSFYSRLQIFGTFFLLGFAEILLYFLYSDLPISESNIKDIESVDEANKVFKQENLSDSQEFSIRRKNFLYSAETELEQRYLRDQPELFRFIQEYIDFTDIDLADSVVLNEESLAQLEPVVAPGELLRGGEPVSPQDTILKMRALKRRSLKLFVNLHRVNDIRRINRYFLEVHKKLVGNAGFVGRVETISTHRRKILNKYPKYIGRLIYYLNFIVFRMFPKIPIVKNLYFVFTRGKNRVLSQAEVLGRLHFCGFKVTTTREIGNCLYFIARKMKHPSIDKNPSYGPIIKLRRVGFKGKIIYINKFRTMHPYSEYLQEYIYENYKLNPNGKFSNDIRVTSWGRAFRKFWIDELPQIANFFQGDIAFIGVRALSQHYYDLYPEDLQELRIQFYPGLVPPYYADMPKSFDEIVESERNYLKQKEKHPFVTDIKYLCKAFINIFFRKARST